MDSLGGFNPGDIQKYLDGINWPAEKDEVANKAEGNGAPEGMLAQIKNLGGGKFSGPQEVVSTLQG